MRQWIKNVFVATAMLLAACHQPHYDPVPRTATVLILGDSVSYGTGAGRGEDYPALLAGMTGWNVINAGVPGDTTAEGLERLPGLLEEHSPGFIVVELGGNDFLHKLPREETAANLKKILALIKEKNIPSVLVAVPQPNLFGAAVGNLSDDPVFEQIGKETGVPVISEVLSDVLAKNTLKSDPIHPNADGYRKLAEGLRENLKSLGFLK